MTSPTEHTVDPSDPGASTVDQVNKYLDENPDQVQAVLAAERTGKARTGVLEGPHAQDTTTRAQTFQEAATTTPQAVSEAYEQGFIGTSPERERTGLADKGLSQATPSVMDASLPPVDARPSVDDSEAIAAAQRAQGQA